MGYNYCYIIAQFFFFNDTATTEIYTLSLHDALPIWGNLMVVLEESPLSVEITMRCAPSRRGRWSTRATESPKAEGPATTADRKSTRLNSSHANISYAVFCLKKKTTPHSHLSYAVFCL